MKYERASKQNVEGKVFNTKNYGDVVVLEYNNNNDVRVKFLNSGYEVNTYFCDIKTGLIRDRLAPTVYGVGIIGEETTRDSGKMKKEYSIWAKMLQRCYSDNMRHKHPTYTDCLVSENFKYFPYFREWCSNQVGFGNGGFELDKDILVKGNKIYSDGTCCFVPHEVNSLLVNRRSNRGKCPIGVHFNRTARKFEASCCMDKCIKHLGYCDTAEEAFLVYKEAKEAYIKVVANKWKDRIDSRVYEALMNWEVEIDD